MLKHDNNFDVTFTESVDSTLHVPLSRRLYPTTPTPPPSPIRGESREELGGGENLWEADYDLKLKLLGEVRVKNFKSILTIVKRGFWKILIISQFP